MHSGRRIRVYLYKRHAVQCTICLLYVHRQFSRWHFRWTQHTWCIAYMWAAVQTNLCMNGFVIIISILIVDTTTRSRHNPNEIKLWMDAADNMYTMWPEAFVWIIWLVNGIGFYLKANPMQQAKACLFRFYVENRNPIWSRFVCY